ncbi:S1 RNA-binding domain-containing protein [Lysinibacillus sphaericus]|uniref:S1 RNA-binding domain-containing protein n=1 Tax=Lysinibacillus sphaericus TaxID=1421 RepID=UPI003F79C35D
MLENYKLDSNVMIEGYDATQAQKMNNTDLLEESWRVVFESRQNKTLLQAEVKGLQNTAYSIEPLKEELCAVIEVGMLKGLIPLRFLETDEKRAYGLLGQKVAFVVIALDQTEGFFVGSREEALRIMASAALRRLNEGDITTGVIRQVFPTNMLVDVGGITASIPASEVSYAWVDSLRDHYVVGQHVKVKITSINKEDKSIKVSIKALLPDPFTIVTKDYKEGGVYVGFVSGIKEFGIYVTLRDGVSGLAPFPPKFVVEKGDKVSVRFGKVDMEKRHINLRIERKI